MVIAAYNAAGERVRVIYSGGAQYLPGSLDLSAPVFIGGDGQITIRFPGAFATGGNTLVWDGSNDNGAMIKGGMYTIKAEIVDPFGKVTSLVQDVQVLPGGTQQFLRIFNAAGEVVRTIHLPVSVKGANGLRMGDTSFGLQVNPSTGAAFQDLKIDVLGISGYQSFAWDGLNQQGLPVNGGTYVIQLVSEESAKETVVSSRSVTVIKGAETTDATASALIAPNPVLPTQKDLAVYYDPNKLFGRSAECRLFNLAGEQVGNGDDPARSGKIVLSPSRALASGTYLVRFEIRVGSVVTKARILKMAIVR